MTAHARFAQDGAFEVHAGVGLQGAEICAAEGFGGDADLEPGFVEGRYCKAGSWFDAIMLAWWISLFGGVWWGLLFRDFGGEWG